jgi:signal transduction histidine kinase
MAAIVIAMFQGYWLFELFTKEKISLKKQLDVVLKQSVQNAFDNFAKNDTIKNGFDSYSIKKTNIANAKKKTSIAENIKNSIGTIKKDTNIEIQSRVVATKIFFNKKLDTSHRQASLIPMSDSEISKLVYVSINDSNFKQNATHPKLSIKLLKRDSITKYFGTDKKEIFAKNRVEKKVFEKKNGINSMSISINDLENSYEKYSNLLIKYLLDTMPVKLVDSILFSKLIGLQLPHNYKITINVLDKTYDEDSLNNSSQFSSVAAHGFYSNFYYKASFKNYNNYLSKKLLLPVLISLLLFVFLIMAYVILYKNLRTQQKLNLLKNDLISNITHELKTPIATVSVAIEALKNFNAIDDKEKSKQYLEISSAEINRLGLLVDKVLKLSMFEHDKIDLQIETFDINKLIIETADSMQLQFSKKQILLHVNLDNLSKTIDADKLHISSVIYNLLDNAIKYSASKTNVTITTKQHENYVLLTVEDQGCGIAEEHLSKIFDKFFRVSSNDTHNANGYGLGLSYVKYIVEKHNGIIALQSTIDKGSCFSIQLQKGA